MSMRLKTIGLVLLCLGVVLGTTLYSAAQTKKADSKKKAVAETEEDNPVNVMLFDAMKDGLVKVDVKANNPFSATVTVSNISDEHLLVDLPTSFALTPVLAQYGGYGGGGMGGYGGGMMGGMGGMGGYGGGMGGYGGGGMGGYGGGGYGGRYNIVDDLSESNRKTGRSYKLAPKKYIKETVRTVCLEHGKADPTPKMKYEMRPLSDVTPRKEVQVLCELRGNDAVHPDVVQAAVWNLNNDMSWDELNAKPRITIGANLPARPYFAPGVLEAAQRLADEALVVAEQLKAEEETQKREEESKDLHEYTMAQDEK